MLSCDLIFESFAVLPLYLGDATVKFVSFLQITSPVNTIPLSAFA
ncbi:hypothetical protein THOD03_50277 [Vibrio harveyi]|nr:hypothetical protein THOD03_50277 [Vibrio harveyi]